MGAARFISAERYRNGRSVGGAVCKAPCLAGDRSAAGWDSGVSRKLVAVRVGIMSPLITTFIIINLFFIFVFSASVM